MSRYGHDSEEPRRSKLYRNKRDGMIAGVCAGFADYFGFDLGMTRVVVVIAAFVFPTLILVYLVLALVLKKAPPRFDAHSDREEGLGRRVRAEPHATLSNVRHRFRDLDARLQRLEKYVTSERFRLDREFEGLKE
jgi:phage shock protein C